MGLLWTCVVLEALLIGALWFRLSFHITIYRRGQYVCEHGRFHTLREIPSEHIVTDHMGQEGEEFWERKIR